MTPVPQGRQCKICGHSNPDVLEEHHLVPQRYGGSDAPENLVHLCGSCHNAIESLYDDQFYERLGVDTTEGSSESAAPVPSGESGLEIEKADSVSREIPEDSPHVVFQSLRGVQWNPKPDWVEKLEDRSKLPDGPAYAIHCSYCHTVFSHLEHPEAARHLQIEHGVENPYEGAEQEEIELSSGFSHKVTNRVQGTGSLGVEVQQNRLTPSLDIEKSPGPGVEKSGDTSEEVEDVEETGDCSPADSEGSK